MPVWTVILIIGFAGAIGGVINAFLANEGLILWRIEQLPGGARIWRPGFVGTESDETADRPSARSSVIGGRAAISREIELDLSTYLSETLRQLSGWVSDPRTTAPEAAYTAELLNCLSRRRALAAERALSGSSNMTPPEGEDLKRLLLPLKTSSIRGLERLNETRTLLEKLSALMAKVLETV